MWYLNIDTLGLMLGLALIFILAGRARQKFFPESRFQPAQWLVVLDLALLCYVSWELALFYVVYTGVSFLLVHLLFKAEKRRKLWFALFCLVDIAPFLYVRVYELIPDLPPVIALIGFSYNMLKAVDCLFFVYFTKLKIPFLHYANFLLFFPVFTSGPIFRYRDFAKSYENPRIPGAADFEVCVKRVIRGLFKKMVVLAWMGELLSYVLSLGQHWYASVALVAVSYAMLYLDLSGYSDIAVGVGTAMGITVPENFKNPLSAASFTQFWRKWHVTLSDWIREHIFVLLNGKKLNKYQGAAIGVVTMLVMSLWYHFSWVAILDGLYMGAFLAIENLFGWTTVDKRKTKKPVYYARCALVAFFFGANAMTYILDGPQLLTAIGGFFKL